MTQFLPTLLSQASPIYPLQAAYDPSNPVSELSWINEDKVFINWLAKRDINILHVHGTSNISKAGEYIFQRLDSLIDHSTDHSVLYFEFKQHDARFNTLKSMLSTFLAQIICHYPILEDTAVNDLEFLLLHKSWTSKDLYALSSGLRRTRLIGSITYVINRLDLCEEPFDWFLNKLLSIAKYSESRYKIVIISRTSEKIQNVFSESPTIDIDCHGETDGSSSDFFSSMVSFELAALCQEHPRYSSFESTLAKLFSGCGKDIHLCRLIADYLRFGTNLGTSLSIGRCLENLSLASPKTVLEMIMESIKLEKQNWARTVIALVLCSLRPLTLLELQATLTLQGDLEERESERTFPPDILAELHQYFGGVFVVHNGEVCFGHPDARGFFMPSESSTHSWFTFEDQGIAHAVIASFCLGYLSLPRVRKQMSEISSRPTDLPQSPIPNARTNLLPYVIRYWPDHYQLALSLSPESESTRSTTQAVSRSLEDSEAVFLWAKSYYNLSNPFIRPEKTLSSILSIVSSLGLHALVQKFLPESHSEESESLSSALVEAARGDHLDVLRLLLDAFRPSQLTLRDALKAAATCQESKSLTLLLDYVSEHIENFEWQQDLLYRAAWLGLENVVRHLSNSGADLNPSTPLAGLSPLHLAARNNHIGVVKTLLEKNESLGINALQYACIHGHPEIVKLIYQENSDLGSKDQDGWSPLQRASYQGHHEVVEVLLEAGADANYCKEGDQPLAVATQSGHIKCCQSLLRHGANLKFKSATSSPILILAVRASNSELVELLLDNGAEIDEEGFGFTALSLATEIGSKDIVSCLIKRNANVNRPEEAFDRPVYVAARQGYHELLQLLIEADADVNIFTSDGWGPLHIAYDHPEVARVLLESGVDLNRASDAGTPLHLASKWNYPEVMKVYLQHKPNLEIALQSYDYYGGMAALCVATAQGNTEIVRMLLEEGANVNQRAQFNYFPLQYAICLSSAAVAEDTLKALIEYNASLDLCDDGGNTALHYIRSYTPVSTIKPLVNAGADIEIGDIFGFTPICNAVKYQNMDAMEYLLSKGAKVNFTGGFWGGGPLHLACFLGLLEFIKTLVENGADVNLANPGTVGTPLISVCSGRFDDDEVTNREGKNEQGIYVPAIARDKILGIPEGMSNPNEETKIDHQEGMQKQIIRYLIEEVNADVNLSGGSFGYPLNSACLQSSPEIVGFLLEKGARTDVKDDMGRMPIHFAAFRTTGHFESLIGSATCLPNKDKLGLIPLHYAVASGRVELVKRVLEFSAGLVNAPDCDNWTPLLWAARTCGRWKTTNEKKPEIIRLLISAGADLWVKGSGLDREWSPLKVARYYGADEEVINLLTPTSKERVKHGMIEYWDERFHLSRKATNKSNVVCDGCLHVSLSPCFPHKSVSLSFHLQKLIRCKS